MAITKGLYDGWFATEVGFDVFCQHAEDSTAC
jgi:hypothetical protein